MAAGLALGLAGCEKVRSLTSPEADPPATAATPSNPSAGVERPVERGTSETDSASPQATPVVRSPDEIIDAFLAKPPGLRTNADLEELAALEAGLDRITELDLKGSRVGDAGLKVVGRLPLATLDISQTSVSNEGLQVLAELPGLKSLIADDLGRADEGGFTGLERCTALEELSLQSSLAADAVFRRMRGLRQLRVLRVGGATNLLGREFTALVKDGGFPELRELHAGNSPFVTYGLLELNRLKQLETLDASHPDTHDVLVEGFQNCLKLKRLRLAGSRVTVAGLKLLGKLRSLEELDLSRCAGVNDAALAALRPLKSLRQLSLDGAGCTADGVAMLKKSLPDATIRFNGAELP
ncbi:MAG: hypothetical protein KF774_18215 [Planctomyces sp.]|nr:hypothetical protein [Planctomyces sp.]